MKNTHEAPMIEIDGSLGEGGGQILRNAIAYASVLSRTTRISNIRKGRATPGLRPQHLQGIQLVAQMSGAHLTGDAIGSTEITFIPRAEKTAASAMPKKARNISSDTPAKNAEKEDGDIAFECDTKTAGSTSLLIQASIPTLLKMTSAARRMSRPEGGTQFKGVGPQGPGHGAPQRNRSFSPSRSAVAPDYAPKVLLKGGTAVAFAPLMDYVQGVFVPLLREFGVGLLGDVLTPGYFPKGGGSVLYQAWMLGDETDSAPRFLSPVTWTETGKLDAVGGVVWAAGANDTGVLRVLENEVKGKLPRALGGIALPMDGIKFKTARNNIQRERAYGATLYVRTSTGRIIGASSLSDRKTTPEQIATDTVESLKREIQAGGCVDSHMADQLVQFAVFAKGQTRIKIAEPVSLHLRTAVDVAKLFGASVELVPKGGGFVELVADGFGTEF